MQRLEGHGAADQGSGLPLLAGRLPPNNMLVFLTDGSSLAIVHAATLSQKLQIKLSISSDHSYRHRTNQPQR